MQSHDTCQRVTGEWAYDGPSRGHFALSMCLNRCKTLLTQCAPVLSTQRMACTGCKSKAHALTDPLSCFCLDSPDHRMFSLHQVSSQTVKVGQMFASLVKHAD